MRSAGSLCIGNSAMAASLPDGSRVRRESHARFCERLEVKSLRPTHPTVPVLAKLKTVIGRIGTYVRDDRPFGGTDPPAALFYYSRQPGWRTSAKPSCRRSSPISKSGSPAANLALIRQRSRKGDQLPAQPLGGVHPLPGRWPHLPLEQRCGTSVTRCGCRKTKLDLRRFRCWRQSCRRCLYPDPNLQDEPR
ncbi:hypothetical protein SAMN05216337_101042 [Bradyrhizobium brasilense]|uniref:Transposase n=1 Tax=Bradyrhizobium brasilense TaxID=1419277 RepID=A0A1G6TX78_9BRAD|nr:hypothetical protein SAMN05216337_101042 [Bradyrhizobium brasilense]